MSSFTSKLQAPLAKALLWMVTGAALATAVFLSARMQHRDHQVSRDVVRAYAVAAPLLIPMRVALEYVLAGKGKVIETGIGGQLLISAPQSIQDQIPALFASLGNTVNKAPTLRFDVWYLVATDGPSNLDDPSLQAIRSTLEQIVKVDGPKRFEIRLRKGLRVQSGAEARSNPIFIRNARLLRRDDGTEVVAAELELGREDLTSPLLRTQVEVAPGETLVIGQTTSRTKERPEDAYQIVRASL